jgi:hypothetical protein
LPENSGQQPSKSFMQKIATGCSPRRLPQQQDEHEQPSKKHGIMQRLATVCSPRGHEQPFTIKASTHEL